MSNEYYNVKIGLRDKGRLLTLKELEDLNIPEGQDAYTSIFKYNDKHKATVDVTKSIAGITDVTTNCLVWDFDNKANPELARQDVVTLAHRLNSEYDIDPSNIHCYFSGSKGFHVYVPIDKSVTPEEFKAATSTLAKDLATFDSVVSDPARVIRLEHTKHPVTGLYKIPLTADQVCDMTIDQIKFLAVKNETQVDFNDEPVTLPKSVYGVPKKEKKAKMVAKLDFDPKSTPRGWKVYKWAIAQGHFESGERHQALLVLAATCRALGYSKEQSYYLCKAALKKQSETSGTDEFNKEELWKNIIEDTVFHDKWEGGQYSPSTNPWLAKYCEKHGFDTTKDKEDDRKVVQLEDIEAGFEHYVKHIEENTILTGIKPLDVAMPLTTGMNLGVIGAASSGKTALALSILKNTSQAGVVSVFASLDMHRNRLFEKLLYKVSGLSREVLYERIKTGQAQDIFDKVRAEYKNVYFYDRSRPTVGDIRDYITKVQETTGKTVKLVMLDYFERVNSEKSEDTAASKDISGQLQDLVNDFDICMVTLVQPNKFSLAAGPDCPILNYTAIKGSSFLYQSFRSIISIWRPFFNPEHIHNDKFMQMAILKNDLGELAMFDFGWSGKKGDIWELAEEGRQELKELLEEKNRRNSNSEDEGW